MRNYTIIAIILILIVLIFTSRSTSNDLTLFSDALSTLREEREISQRYDNEQVKEEKAEEPKQEEKIEVAEETQKPEPQQPVVSNDNVKPIQIENVKPQNKTQQTPTIPEKSQQSQVVKNYSKQEIIQEPVYQEPPKPKNPYQKVIDDDNFPARVYTPNMHIKYVVFSPSTLRYGTLTNTMGYALNFPFSTEQERARNYFKISNVIDNSPLNNKCIYEQTAEYQTSRPTNYLYCDATKTSLSELENVAAILQNRGYEVYISDQIISKEGYYTGTQWVWRTYNGSYYD